MKLLTRFVVAAEWYSEIQRGLDRVFIHEVRQFVSSRMLLKIRLYLGEPAMLEALPEMTELQDRYHR